MSTDIKGFQDFLTMGDVPEDMRHNMCARLCNYEADGEKSKGQQAQWILGNDTLKKLILEVV